MDGGKKSTRGRQGPAETLKRDATTSVEAGPSYTLLILTRAPLVQQILHLLILVFLVTLCALIRRQVDGELRQSWYTP